MVIGKVNLFTLEDRELLRNIRELYQYRAIIWSLVGRELKARYRGSMLGLLWTLLNPLFMMGIYVLVFSIYMRIGMENYASFLLCGLIPWLWFCSSMNEGATSIVTGGSLITKALFPPQILPAVKVLSNMVNFFLSLPILLFFLLLKKVELGLPLLVFPAVVILQLIFTMGLVMMISALNVHFRDVQHIISNFLTLWFFLCPIIYPLSLVPEKLRFCIFLNPMGLLTMVYQDIFFFKKIPEVWQGGVLLVVSLLAFSLGNRVFNRYRDGFAEEV